MRVDYGVGFLAPITFGIVVFEFFMPLTLFVLFVFPYNF